MTRKLSDRSIAPELEDALAFLVHHVEDSGHNPKPVMWHSVQVSTRLFDEGFGREAVIAALLHDVLEDTEVAPQAISECFGREILRLVEAVTFDSQQLEPRARFFEHFERVMIAGPDVIAIIASDFLDNSFYYGPPQSPEDMQNYRHVLWKARMFLSFAADQATDPRLFAILNDLRDSVARHPQFAD